MTEFEPLKNEFQDKAKSVDPVFAAGGFARTNIIREGEPDALSF
ncbi:MAG: hypothetical protein ACRBDL_09760 [Alphaproteobacteria bacterium]